MPQRDEYDDRAGAHTWTEIVSRVRFGTQKALGKTVSGARIHSVAERIARYATHKTGSDVRPGLARIAVDMEMDYKTVRAAVAVLVRTGLLRVVAKGARAGDADEYQLTIPADLLDRDDVEVWSPARYRLELERVRERVRGKYRRPDLQGPDGPQGGKPAGATGTAEPVDNSEPAGATGTADVQFAAKPAGATGTADDGPAGPCGTNLRSHRDPPPISDHVPKRDLPRDDEVRTAVTVGRTRADEPDSDEGGQASTPPALRLIVGNPDPSLPAVTAPALWPAPVDSPRRTPPRHGIGFCIPCHADGKSVLAADPTTGSACAYHLRIEAS